jgi:hypothetical protein
MAFQMALSRRVIDGLEAGKTGKNRHRASVGSL